MSRYIDDFKLVNLVKQYPILYEKSLTRGQKNSKEKDEVWQIISSQLGISERACITRWKSIRDRFGKEYRRIQENSNEATNWKLLPSIMFLRNHYKYGNVTSDEIVVKYEPKTRNNKRLSNKLQDGNIDPEDLLINQQLIALVKAHPVLYHKKYIRDSKKLTAKNDAWFRISKILCLSEEDAYNRWKKLRDRFAREFRYHKIQPEKPITWLYFSELEFLEDHYRKGVPLPLEKIRKEKQNSADSSVEESYDVDDQNFSDNNNSNTTESMDHMDPESFDYCDRSFEQLEEMELNDNTTETFSVLPSSTTEVHPEQQLVNVISNMENLLKQTQKCLSSLQHQQTPNVTETLLAPSEQPLLIRRMQLLLSGLCPEQRNIAKRKILQFLCESQIKSDNNEIIDDVINVKIK